MDNGYPNMAAYRYFYRKYKGEIPKNWQIDHLCRNKICVNPLHLEAVTAQENIHRSKVTKLNNKQIEEIRNLYRTKQLNQPKIAQLFSIHQCNVSRIVNYRRWNA